jgi:hypothetical protein
MTTIVNSPAPESNGGSSGLIIGIFVLVVLGLLFYYFGIPAIRRMGSIQPQINIPSQIDVNVKTGN